MQRTEKIATYIVIALCVSSFIFLDAQSMALSASSMWWTRLTYQFAHASVVHLALNCVFFYLAVSRYHLRLTDIILAYAAAVTLPSVLTPRLVAGLSGMIFFFIGSMLFLAPNRLRFLRSALVPVIIAFFIPGISAACHMWCLCLGFIYSYLWKRRLQRY